MIESAERLQTLFDEYVAAEIEDGSNTLNLFGFTEYAKENGEPIDEIDGYDTPIGGFKSFYQLAGDNPHEIEEHGYDEFIVADVTFDEDVDLDEDFEDDDEEDDDEE